MNKRSYKKYTEVYTALEQYCKAYRPGSSLVLPGECQLAIELQTSRMTLRKAIEKATINGLLERKGKHTEVLLPQLSLQKCGKILFIATGYYNEPLPGALQRLWIKLKPQLENLGADVQLLLNNDLTTQKEMQDQCEAADVILLTICCPAVNMDFFQAMKSRKVIIALSDPHLEQFDNCIALDNYAVGELAAQALLLAGCHNPTFIANNSENIMFHKRFRGFCDTMQQHDIIISKDSSFPFPNSEHFTQIRRQELLSTVHRGCDGVFIVSDEGIESITHDMFEQNIIPNKLKLITVNGIGEALLCRPPITCVNHATDSVIHALLTYLKKLSKNPNIAPVKQLIKPDLYLNKTIGKITTNLMEKLI